MSSWRHASLALAAALIVAAPGLQAADCTLNLLPVTTGNPLHGELAVGEDSGRRLPFVTGEVVAIDGLECDSEVLVQAGQSQGFGVPFFRVWKQSRIRVDPEASTVKYPIPPRRQVDIEVRSQDDRAIVGAGVWLRAQETQGPRAASHTLRTDWEGRSRAFLRIDAAYQIRTLGLDKDALEVEIGRQPAVAPHTIEAGSNPVTVLIRTTGTSRVTAVVQTDTGGGVSGVEFDYLYGPEKTRFLRASKTDDEGRVAFSARAYPVVLQPRDPRRRYKFDPPESTIPGPEDSHEVVFRAVDNDEDTVTLRFLDPETAEGVEGVSVNVEFFEDEEPIDHQFFVPTDEEGEIRATCHVGARLEVDARAPHGNYRRLRHDDELGDCETLTFELAAGMVVHGTVVDSAGVPVPDLGLSVANRKHRTDGEGRFSAAGLSAGTVTITGYGIEDSPGPKPIIGIAGENGELLPALVKLEEDQAEATVELVSADPARACIQAGIPEELESVSEIAVYAFLPGSDNAVKEYSKQPCTARLLPGVYQLLAFDKNGWLVPSWWPGRDTRRDARMVDLPEGIRDSLEIAMVAAGKLELTHDFLQERHVWRNTVWRKQPDDEQWTLLRRGVDYRSHDKGPLEIKGLPPGDWLFRLCEDAECRGRSWISPDPLTIQALGTAKASTIP